MSFAEDFYRLHRTLLLILILLLVGFSFLLVWFQMNLNEFFVVECKKQLAGESFNFGNYSFNQTFFNGSFGGFG